MEHLPPVGWADVATKRDLDSFKNEMRAEFGSFKAEMRAEFAEFKAQMFAAFNKQTDRYIAWMLTAMTLLTGVSLAAGKLL